MPSLISNLEFGEKGALNMKDRLKIGTISILLLIGLIAFAYHSLFQFVVALLTAALAAIAVWEYQRFAKDKGVYGGIFPRLLIACTVLLVFSFFAAAQTLALQSLPFLIFFIGFLVFFAFHFKQRQGALIDLAISTFGLLYIAVPMGMLLSILYSPPRLLGEDGRWWLAYLLVVTKITDVGGYVGGSLWGKTKLAPAISPKKTVEGAFVGFLCAMGASYCFHVFSEASVSRAFQLQLKEALLLGFILGIVSQFGDLSESLLKRDANKKDSNALPGIGGALDAIDSLLFNAPILYFYLHYVKS
jgi:phosphatidate cytidylyltransferase